MMYNSIFAKSFSRYEQKKLGYGAFVGCLIIVLSLCTVFKPYIGSIHDLKLKLYVSIDTKMLMLNETNSFPQIARVEETETKKMEQGCFSEERTNFCQVQGDIRVHGKSSSVYIVTPETTILPENSSWTIRPYARKDDAEAMRRVREWSIKAVKDGMKFPQCTQHHSIPAVIFSTSGYIGNHFHEFTDIIIPLFLTSRQFNGQVKFVVSEMRPWWISKYQAILSKLSNYEVLNIDKDDKVHCFPGVNVGLKRYPKELSIDPQKYSYSIKDFRSFLRDSYSLKRVNAIKLREEGEDENNKNKKQQPRLLILSRRRTRSFTNTAEIANMARRMGFEAIVMEAGGSMSNFANVVNSCDVLLGVHGAGLTNIVFLPENAVLIQVVPHGGFEWLAKYDFELPSKNMGLKYLDYKISVEESTLIQQYPLDHMIIKHPPSIGKLGWERFKSVYLEQQNVMLDLNRFRPTLQKALELLHQ
ncbi:alpha-1,3-arabinosyltransferase XAT3-like [Arachis stenosperma]|uniref:alpha-1,3-arabinosyltransferase XAT3-like n=1 Tax=Arachis stenosperma TaxID=217475 RepID=UPI0025AD542F|nr:alpha-1,3-arabinosyltransferase XAT3-like [Arachis stenosperma]